MATTDAAIFIQQKYKKACECRAVRLVARVAILNEINWPYARVNESLNKFSLLNKYRKGNQALSNYDNFCIIAKTAGSTTLSRPYPI